MRNEINLYIVMRDDLPSLNPGKLAAQAAHVANVAVKRGARGIVRRWERQTTQGFGTTIVLGASLGFIEEKMRATVVWDPTYPCEILYEVGVHLVANGQRHRVYMDHDRAKAVYLRREIVGAWHIGGRPQIFDELELYP
jgi:hypothetical protein